MEELIYTEHLVLIDNIEHLKHQSGDHKGKFIHSMPYWIRLSGGDLWFGFIGSHLSIDRLQAPLASRQLFIRKSDLKPEVANA